MQPIVARPRPILVSAGLVFAGLVFAGLISADPILAGLILAARFIVSPAFARLRFVGPIFGSHVSKDYSRKSRFDKSSKHSFREISVAPAASSGTKCKSHRHHQHRIYIPAPGPQSGPISGTIRGNTVTFSFTYPTNAQDKRTYTGTISRRGAVSGSWSQTGTQVPNNGTWSLGSRANHACPRFWWWNPRHECFVRGH